MGMQTGDGQGLKDMVEEMDDLVESELLATSVTASPRRHGLGNGASAPLANPRRVRAVAWPTRHPDLGGAGDEQTTEEIVDLAVEAVG